MKRYRKRPTEFVVAIQITLDLIDKTICYQKSGGQQMARKGDWLVQNGGDVYTVNEKSFDETYESNGIPGQYVKSAPVWALRVQLPGEIGTKEGVTKYRAGDYLVYNNANGTDGYAVGREKFEKMYMEA